MKADTYCRWSENEGQGQNGVSNRAEEADRAEKEESRNGEFPTETPREMGEKST